MTTGITFNGLASGIDTAGIVDKLMTLARRPKQLLQDKVDLDSAKQAVYSTLSSKVSALKVIVDEFQSVIDPVFKQKTAISSDSSVLNAVITGSNPAIGSFQVNVTQLATAAMVSSSAALYTGSDANAQAARVQSASGINAPALTVDPTQSLAAQAANFNTAPQASGTVVINGHAVTWNNSMSMNEIIGRINGAGAGVTASFNEVSQTLSIASQTTGSEASVVISETAGNFLASFNLTAGTVQGTDAVIPDFSAAVGSADAHLDRTVTSGVFTVNGTKFYVDAATDTMQTIAARINDSNAGVSVSYDTSTGEMSFLQKNTGSANQLVLGASGDTSNILYALKLSADNPPQGGGGNTYSGANASVSINGGAAQSIASNTAQGLIPGVTLNLQSIGTSTIAISADTEGIVSKVNDFVNQYNAVMDFINAKQAETHIQKPTSVAEKIQGAFIGDSLFSDTKFELEELAAGVVSGLPGDMNQLAQLGITLTADDYGKSGKIKLDESKLRETMNNQSVAVQDVVNGIMSQMHVKLDAMTDFVSGSFSQAVKGMGDEVSYLSTRMSEMEESLLKTEQMYKTQFANMESKIASLNSIGSQLSSLFNTSN